MFSQSGLTSLHLAAQEDKVGVGEILVKQGANLDQQTKVSRLYYMTKHFWLFYFLHLLICFTDHGTMLFFPVGIHTSYCGLSLWKC